MKRMPAVLVLSLGILMSASGVAQSIGPDGRPLQTYSGDVAATAPASSPIAPVLPSPASPKPNPVASAPAAAAPPAPVLMPALVVTTSEPSHPEPIRPTVPPPHIVAASATYRRLNASAGAA